MSRGRRGREIRRAPCLALIGLVAGAPFDPFGSILAAQDPDVFIGATAVLFTNAIVVDGRGGEPRPNSAILVWNGRIRAIGPRAQLQVPQGTAVVDLEGAHVVPGFIDAYASPRDPATLAAMLRLGITGVVEPAMPLAEFEARGRDPPGDDPLPTVYIGGPALDAAGGAGLALDSETAIEAAIARLVDIDGAEFVSVTAGVPAAWMVPIARAARARDAPVWAEGKGPGWLTRVRAGADVTSHLISGDPELLGSSPGAPPMTRDSATMGPPPGGDDPASTGDVAAGDLAVWLSRVDPSGDGVERAVNALLSRDAAVIPMLAAAETAVCGSGVGDCRSTAAWSSAEALVRTLHDDGVRLLVGSGAPAETEPGSGFHRELRLLADAGIPSVDVISMATRNAAVALGILHDRGTLEVGKRADFVVLGADPLADIDGARQVVFVVLEGRGWRPLEDGGFERLDFR